MSRSPAFRYPHMCRDGHVEIGHSDSDNGCPLCAALRRIPESLCRCEEVDGGGGVAFDCSNCEIHAEIPA